MVSLNIRQLANDPGRRANSIVGKVSAAAGGVLLAAALVACAAPPTPPAREECNTVPASIQVVLDDTNGGLPPGSLALVAAGLAHVRAGDEFGVTLLSGKAGEPAKLAPGEPCSDVMPDEPDLSGLDIGRQVAREKIAGYEAAKRKAEVARQALQAWRDATLAEVAGFSGPLAASQPHSAATGLCERDGWPAAPLARVPVARPPLQPVIILDGCQANFAAEQPRLPEGIWDGVMVIVVGAVGEVDAREWFEHTGADWMVVDRDRPRDLEAAMEKVRDAAAMPGPLRPASAAATMASMAPVVLSIPSMLGDVALIATLSLVAGLVVLAAYGILGALMLDALVWVTDHCRAGISAVLRWGGKLTSTLRQSEPAALAARLRAGAAGGGDIAEDILQGLVLFATATCLFALTAVGAPLIGVWEIPGVRKVLPWILGVAVLLGAALAFHHLRHNVGAERKWAMLAVALAITAAVCLAAAKGADFVSQQALRDATIARQDYADSALIAFTRKFAPFAFIATATAQVVIAGFLADLKVLGRFASFLTGGVLAGLVLLPALLYFGMFAVPIAGFLGLIFVPVALVAVFPGKVREWLAEWWNNRNGGGDMGGAGPSAPTSDPSPSDVQTSAEPARSRASRKAAAAEPPTGGVAIF